jgi:hypothetical protein
MRRLPARGSSNAALCSACLHVACRVPCRMQARMARASSALETALTASSACPRAGAAAPTAGEALPARATAHVVRALRPPCWAPAWTAGGTGCLATYQLLAKPRQPLGSPCLAAVAGADGCRQAQHGSFPPRCMCAWSRARHTPPWSRQAEPGSASKGGSMRMQRPRHAPASHPQNAAMHGRCCLQATRRGSSATRTAPRCERARTAQGRPDGGRD